MLSDLTVQHFIPAPLTAEIVCRRQQLNPTWSDLGACSVSAPKYRQKGEAQAQPTFPHSTM